MSRFTSRRPVYCIVPPYIFEKMLESKDKATREAALSSLLHTSQVRGVRMALAEFGFAATSAVGSGRRTIFDCGNSFLLEDAVLARSEDGPASEDDSVNRLFEGLGATRDFLSEVFDRNSLDDRGGRLDGYVHYGADYNNATFDGSVMRFGDGDGEQFTDFTLSLDVIAHELGHGVTQYTSDLRYRDQSGALNESFSDVFGSLVKQWIEGQSVDQADWLIGKDVWTPGTDGDALRSLKSPGKAYVNHPLYGTDPQPAHMNKYVVTTRDNGGVHYNSGIPNRAFYEAAMLIGGNAWEVSGQIWYKALRESTRLATFADFAATAYGVASADWGAAAAQSVAEGWKAVGVSVSGAAPQLARGRRPAEQDGLASLSEIVKSLTKVTKRLDALERTPAGPRRHR